MESKNMNEELIERISKLETLVDSLCVGAAGWKNEQQALYHTLKNKALHRGLVVLREADARDRLNRLQEEQKILLEDYPHLKESS